MGHIALGCVRDWEVIFVNEKDVLTALQRMREASKARKFEQTVEFVMNFRGVDFKKPQNRINVDVTLPFATGKIGGTSKIAVFVKDKNFAAMLKEKGAKIIMENEIEGMKKKDIEQLITDYNTLLAEGPVMLTVGKHLGQQLAPRGKMPRPIQPDMRAYDDAVSQLSGTVKVTNSKGKFMPLIQLAVGKEKMKDAELAKNVLAVYNAVVGNLESKEFNVKNAYLKLTMGPPAKIGAPAAAEQAAKVSVGVEK